MQQRIDIKKLEPEAYQAMYKLESYLEASGLDKNLRELIKIRASQINGCAYCLEMHTEDAMKHGESQRRLFAISAWWESPLFSEKEKAILAVTEEVTLIADKGLTEETFQRAQQFFSENEIAQIIMQIGAINVWNRIAVTSHLFFKP